MWEKTFLLLLHSVEAVVASQCWQGATFSEAVVSPAVESSGIMRVPGVSSLPQCVAACCDLPGYDLAWLFEGRCYILSCQQRENCQPRERPGADSFLAFLRRSSPQTLVLQSLVRGEPYRGRWRPLSRTSEAPGDLEALKDLALFDGPRLDFSDPGILDVEYSEGSQEERGGGGSEAETMTDQSPLKGRDGLNQSEAEDGPERALTQSSVAQIRASSGGNMSRGEEERTRRPTDPAAEKTTRPQSSTVPTSLTPSTTDSTQQDHVRTSALSPTTSHWPSSTITQPAADQPLMMSDGKPVQHWLTVSLQLLGGAISWRTWTKRMQRLGLGGSYTFELVSLSQEATDSASLTVKGAGSQESSSSCSASVYTSDSAQQLAQTLRGSVTGETRLRSHFLWVRAESTAGASCLLTQRHEPLCTWPTWWRHLPVPAEVTGSPGALHHRPRPPWRSDQVSRSRGTRWSDSSQLCCTSSTATSSQRCEDTLTSGEQTKVRKKTKYTILDNMEPEQEAGGLDPNSVSNT
ncbi:dyslexia-associated protein KIAA0319-like protein, partial [Lates japonicus]